MTVRKFTPKQPIIEAVQCPDPSKAGVHEIANFARAASRGHTPSFKFTERGSVVFITWQPKGSKETEVMPGQYVVVKVHNPTAECPVVGAVIRASDYDLLEDES